MYYCYTFLYNLLKALKYDREQYEKGFKEGANSVIEEFRRIIDKYY